MSIVAPNWTELNGTQNWTWAKTDDNYCWHPELIVNWTKCPLLPIIELNGNYCHNWTECQNYLELYMIDRLMSYLPTLLYTIVLGAEQLIFMFRKISRDLSET